MCVWIGNYIFCVYFRFRHRIPPPYGVRVCSLVACGPDEETGRVFRGPRACRGDDECRIKVIRHNCHVTCINAKCYKTRNVRYLSAPPTHLVPRKKKDDPLLLLRLYRLEDIRTDTTGQTTCFSGKRITRKKMKKITSV